MHSFSGRRTAEAACPAAAWRLNAWAAPMGSARQRNHRGERRERGAGEPSPRNALHEPGGACALRVGMDCARQTMHTPRRFAGRIPKPRREEPRHRAPRVVGLHDGRTHPEAPRCHLAREVFPCLVSFSFLSIMATVLIAFGKDYLAPPAASLTLESQNTDAIEPSKPRRIPNRPL
jgi:hypothetical protein